MKQYNVAILGVTGAVGQQMLRVLEEYQFPIAKLLPLASARSAGSKVVFCGQELTVQEATADSFAGMDFVLGAAGSSLSKVFVKDIVRSGAVFIDNSSAFRLEPDVPLVVPEINGADAFKHKGVIANPNCSTIITLMAIAGISKLSKVEAMNVCTYQAVSGAGQKGLDELLKQMQALAEGKPLDVKAFPVQIALNVIPHIGGVLDNRYTDEEMKLQNEGRKILHLPELRVDCTCVRVPVLRSHSISVTLRTAEPVSVAAAEEAIKQFPGCKLMDASLDRDYPTPLDTTDQDIVWVGRVREGLADPNALTLWCCGDQIRKGAASNAVQIMKLLANA